MCGVINELNISREVLWRQGFLYKMSMIGDSINSRLFVSEPNSLKYPSGIIERGDSTGYHIFIIYYNENSACSKMLLTKNLEEISVVNLSSAILADYYALSSSTHLTPIRINDSSILLSARYPKDNDETFFSFIMNDNDSVKLCNYIDDQNDVLGSVTCVNSINGENIYSGYTSNLNYLDPYFNQDTSHIHIVKFNEELNVLWHKSTMR